MVLVHDRPAGPVLPAPPPLGSRQLSPEDHAVLSLLVCHRRGYDDLAALLATDAQEIRKRAHSALGQLVGWAAPDDLGRELMDHALGQLDPAQLDPLADELDASEALRSWDARLTLALGGLMPAQPRMVPPPQPRIAAPVPGRIAVAMPEPWRHPRRPERGMTAAMLPVGLGSIAVGAALFIVGTHAL